MQFSAWKKHFEGAKTPRPVPSPNKTLLESRMQLREDLSVVFVSKLIPGKMLFLNVKISNNKYIWKINIFKLKTIINVQSKRFAAIL